MSRSSIGAPASRRNQRTARGRTPPDRPNSRRPAQAAAARNPARADSEPLQELARLNGVQASYIDMDGRRQEATPEVVAAVLGALGVPATNRKEIRDSLHETASRPWRQCVEPVIVAWDHRPATVPLHLSGAAALQPVHCRLRLESGEVREFNAATSDVPQPNSRGAVNLSGRPDAGRVRQLVLPALPFGGHTVEITAGHRHCETFVISAPARSYSVPSRRAWGFFLPLYAAHSRQSWGAGNFTDWRSLTGAMAALGGTLASTLPLLAAFLDYPGCDPSPYAPASRLFWNEFYVDVTRVPEFQQAAAAQTLAAAPAFQVRLRAFRRSRWIDYRAQWKARRKILECLAKNFFEHDTVRRLEFEKYLRERPAAEEYARFRAMCDRTRTPWPRWPARQRDGDLRPGDYDEATRRFHLYIQWLAHEQVRELIRDSKGHGMALCLDLPLGVHPNGYDVWRERRSYALEASVGAPPDTFFTKGQDWGFPPLHPQRLREQRYRHALDFLRFQLRHAGALRIDHVMGLHRLYWIPKGFPRSHGAYVSYRAEEWHALLSLESHRHRTLLVGENLGTVPPEVNDAMHRHRLRETFVVQYSLRRDKESFLPDPPVRSVASLNTHDMPTFAGHWQGRDLADRADLGLIPKNLLGPKRVERRRLNRDLAGFLAAKRFLKSKKPGAAAVRDACLKWLAAGPAERVLVNLEDLWLETLPQNVPGTRRERPTWRRKARLTIEQLRRRAAVLKVLRDLDKVRRQTGKRSPGNPARSTGPRSH